MPSVLFRLGDHEIRRHFIDLVTCRGYSIRFGQSYKQFPVNHLWIGQDATWPLFGLKVAMWCICAAARLRLQTVLLRVGIATCAKIRKSVKCSQVTMLQRF